VCVVNFGSAETEELLRRAVNGDHGAIGRLFEQYWNELKRVLSALRAPRQQLQA
jgi:hypothetical protein